MLTLTDALQSLAVYTAGRFGRPPLLARRFHRHGVTGVMVTLLYVAMVASFDFVSHNLYTYRAEG